MFGFNDLPPDVQQLLDELFGLTAPAPEEGSGGA
jgi:hypothetical protein